MKLHAARGSISWKFIRWPHWHVGQMVLAVGQDTSVLLHTASHPPVDWLSYMVATGQSSKRVKAEEAARPLEGQYPELRTHTLLLPLCSISQSNSQSSPDWRGGETDSTLSRRNHKETMTIFNLPQEVTGTYMHKRELQGSFKHSCTKMLTTYYEKSVSLSLSLFYSILALFSGKLFIHNDQVTTNHYKPTSSQCLNTRASLPQ